MLKVFADEGQAVDKWELQIMVEAMMGDVHLNGDGMITYEEFARLMF